MSQMTEIIIHTLDQMGSSTDELARLDAELGDGDLGVTVARGSEAVMTALADLDEQAAPAEVLKVAAKAFANANPSTFAALTGGALLNAARSVKGVTALDVDQGVAIARAAADSVATRGKAQVGDKTVLDALLPAVEAMEAATGPPVTVITAGAEAARGGLDQSSALQSQKGRAAWLGERSRGTADPGATAFVRFMEALQSSAEGQS